MKIDKGVAMSAILKIKILASGAIMYIVYDAFGKEGEPMDPISGSGRTAFAIAGAVGVLTAMISLFATQRAVRALGVAVSAIVILALGITYLLVLPTITVGIYFIIALGVSLFAGAGVIFNLPKNLHELVYLNEGLSSLEVNVKRLNMQLVDLEKEVLALKAKILRHES